MNLPFSKLQIKIHALDNPTSVFKKRNLLSLNCINKSNSKKKIHTQLRTYTNDLPHYMMPLKSNLNKNTYNSNNNSNNKKTIKNNSSTHFRNLKLKISKNNYNNSKTKIKLPQLSREKSDHMLYSKSKDNNSNHKQKMQDISMPNINNSFYNIKSNDKSNLNIDNFNNEHKKYSVKDNNNIYSNISNLNLNETDNNNDIILSEQNNNNFQSLNNCSSDSGSQKNINKQFQAIISELQKTINEQNKELSDRNKELELLRNQIHEKENENKINNYFQDIKENENEKNESENINEYKNENELLNKEIERYKSLLNDYKKNNQEKNLQNEINKEMIEKLQKELKNLKDNIESLSDKYQNELNNNKILEEKYKYIKNNTRTPEESTEMYKEKIEQKENLIAKLEEEIYQIKLKKNKFKRCKAESFEFICNINNNDKSQISRTLTREFIVKIEVVDGKLSSNNINNEEGNENVIDSPSKKYVITSSKNSISSLNLIQNDNTKLNLHEKEYNNIQLLLNILLLINNISEDILKEKINQLQNIKYDIQFSLNINELCQNLKISNRELIKQFVNDFLIKDKKGENVLKELYKYQYNGGNIGGSIDATWDEMRNKIFEKCENYDYKKKKTIPFHYLKHLYKEMCYEKKITFVEKNFFEVVYKCKEQQDNDIYSLFDIFYENLIEPQNNNKNINKEKEKKENEKEEELNNINKELNNINNEDIEDNAIKNNISNSNNKIDISNNDDNNLNDKSKDEEIREKNNISQKVSDNVVNETKKLKYKNLIDAFLDKIIKEAIEKQKDEDDDLVKARSFDQDAFSKLILQMDNNNISKLNKSSSDGEENDFDI